MTTLSRLPPLKALRALEALHQTGSVTGAAKRLNVTHSAVSHQIKILENWTDQPLFVRQGRMTILTAAGKSLAAVAHEAFDAIRHEMDRLPLRGVRSISLASLPLAASGWLMPKLRGFTALYPEINLHISLSQTDRPLTPMPDVELRFSLRSQLLPTDIALFGGDAVPVCAPQVMDDYSGNITRLLSHAPLVYDEDLRMWSLWLEKYGIERTSNAIASGLIVEGSAMLRTSALSGHGIALCRIAFIQKDLSARNLIQLSEQTIDEDWCYLLRCSDTKREDPGIASLLAWLSSEAAIDEATMPKQVT